MQFRNSVLVAALSVSSAFATFTKDYKLNAYWGQSGPSTDFLGDHCESDNVDFVTLAFVNNSPEHGNGTGYPGTNFAAHCSAEVYVNNNRDSKLLSSCSYIKDDIRKCQNLGKKVLLSVGGEYTATSDYSLSSVQAGLDFAEFLYGAFGPYKTGYTGPRPFDQSATEHTTIDGFDFDIETKFDDQEPYVHMVNHLRELINNDHEDIILTAAPQCPQQTQNFQMETILQEAQFDKIWVQFYNNPSCEASSAGFNYLAWESFISSGINSAAELYIGFPGSPAAVGADGSGYVDPDTATNLICTYKNSAHFGGAMLWDAYYASVNTDSEGQKYIETIAEALKCGGCPLDVCEPIPNTSSSTTSSATSSTTSFATTSSASTTSTSSSAVTTSSGAYPTATSTSSVSSYITSSPYPTGNSSYVQYTTSTVMTTSVYTVTSCAPTVTNCPSKGAVVTETIPLYTTVCPVTATQKPTTTSVSLTTSTIYSTRVSTITKCPASVTNCPVGSVTTETIAVSTTVCPVTEAQTTTSVAAAATYPGGVYEESQPVKVATVPTYPAAGSSSSVYVPTTLSVAPYPTAKGGSGSGSGSTLSYAATGTGTGYPVTPTGSSVVVASPYPTAPVTAGSAKTASLGLFGLVAIAAFVF
ncbi:glycoside hydrolase superfamily [Hypoxylon sp. NC1633]|nr:glycoside hydrolase superfamily [Hypoxylon sp. NC1633]